jgi:hypothetical protein
MTMKFFMKHFVVILALMLFAPSGRTFTILLPADTAAFLRDGFVSNDSVPIPIQEGLWWNPEEPGSGYSIYVQERVGFVTWYTYETDGRASFYTVQGEVERPGELARVSLGYAALLRGPLVRSRNGQVLDGTWRAPVSEDSGLGTAEFRFLDSRRAELRYTRGVTRPVKLQPFDPGGISEADLLIGRWAIAWRYQPGETTYGIIDIVSDPSSPSYELAGLLLQGPANSFFPASVYCDGPRTTSLPIHLRPPADAKFYTVRNCSEGCNGAFQFDDRPLGPGLQGGDFRFITAVSLSRHVRSWSFWYSPSTRRFGNLSTLSGLAYSCSDPADLFVTRDRIVARGRRVIPFGNNTLPFHHTEFVMSRLPSSSFERYLIPPP